jgi:hypothetical protein
MKREILDAFFSDFSHEDFFTDFNETREKQKSILYLSKKELSTFSA